MSLPLAPVVLKGPTVILRPLTMDDHGALCAAGLDPSLWRLTMLKVRTPDEMRGFIELALAAQAAQTALPFAITLAETGEVVGSTRFHSYVIEHARVEIGFTWVTPRWQRTLVNTESKYLLLRHAFEHLGCQRVQFTSARDNAVSQRALTRIGAQFEGILRAYRRGRDGDVHDVAIFSITSAEWAQAKLQLESMSGVHGVDAGS